jgi:starch synthase (maltosyl-transferring)
MHVTSSPRHAAATRESAIRDTESATRRVIVDAVRPQIDEGRFPIKRSVGESVTVRADVFADGHDLLAGVLKFRFVPQRSTDEQPASDWEEERLVALGNDELTASFPVTELGRYEYTVEAWIDRFGSWVKELGLKADAGQDVSSELLEGAALIEATLEGPQRKGSQAGRTSEAEVPNRVKSDDTYLREIADLLRGRSPQDVRVAAARTAELRAVMDARPDRRHSTTYRRLLEVTVDPVRARYGAWYEMFPRSCTSDARRSGTFREAEARLPHIADMGFDVLYLPPVHPIGTAYRKGRNNSLVATPDDPGSPWAIGSPDGGHTAVEPGLGTIEDFARFVHVANRLGLEVAIDVAFQASPDHPWVREHPAWFKHRPDGTIKYAENPPKKYQDIYPIDFDSREWPSLWEALRDVFLFWISHGVRIFRVDNPHTKSFRFWEWCIGTITRAHPDAIFLAEAFTRPKVMRYLAKLGFNQSYTYFTWRNSAAELRDYLVELTTTDVREYMRPNFFANTPDILHEYLQHGGRPAFEVRLVLAATLGASYGIYSGYELCENVPVRPGSEEYLDSEKYQIKPRDFNAPGNLNGLIARVNAIRREQPALQQHVNLQFHHTDNPTLLWYSKWAPDAPRVFVAANTDPYVVQHGWVEVPLEQFGLADDQPFVIEDLLDGARYTWRGRYNYVRLDPAERMAHIFRVHV